MLVAGLFMRAEYEYRRVTSDIETNINTVRPASATNSDRAISGDRAPFRHR